MNEYCQASEATPPRGWTTADGVAIVIAYLGDRESTEQLTRLASTDARGIAVVFDRGTGPSSADLRAHALADGAMRCHVLDIRDGFVREVVWAAAREGVGERDRRFADLSGAFIDRTLGIIAGIEQGTSAARAGYSPLTGGVRSVGRDEARLELRFEAGEAVALNGISMTPGELAESVETISGVAAVDVFGLAYRALAEAPSGTVTVLADRGVCRVGEGLALPA